MPPIFRAPDARQLFSIWGLRLPDRHWQPEVHAGGFAPIITRHGIQLARLGLVKRWALSGPELAGMTSVPLAEASARSASRAPFEKRRWCIVPALAFFLPHFVDETKAAQDWKIGRRDWQGLGIAGLYDRSRGVGDGGEIVTFALITAECRDHPVLGRFGRSRDAKGGIVSKQAPVLIDSARSDAWLETSPDAAMAFAMHDSLCELAAEAPVSSPALPRATSPHVRGAPADTAIRLVGIGEDVGV